MQDYYRINVAKDGYYLFATEQGNITQKHEADKVIALFQEKFPAEVGYHVSCVHWKYTGEHIL